MPNYEFRCQSCNKQFMKSLPFGSKELPPCPVCNRVTKRLITPPMVHFKGSGFYKTDNAKLSSESTGTPPPEAAKKPDTAPPPAAV